MGTINAVRLININYNNNAIRINDETLHFNGESTLVSLMNGGGKSVMIQMLTAPFVHAKYRNAKDRPFEGYFTGSRPSFILIEWLLDGGAGKLMNGFMVRRNQEDDEDNPNTLDIMGIISEYDRPCMYDINNIPVIEKTKKEITLKSFIECKNLFESLKRDRDKRFYCYDMNQYAQSRQYFERLKEYKIDFREWEEIIKKVNESESGLSYLFSDCKDERGLIEKWLLKSVEKKLDPEGERIKRFREITGKYIKRYRDNESKIKQRDNINLFKENVILDGEKAGARTLAETYKDRLKEREDCINRIADFRDHILSFNDETSANIAKLEADIEDTEKSIKRIDYEKYSYDIHEADVEYKTQANEKALIQREYDQAEVRHDDTLKRLHVLECVKKHEENEVLVSQYNEKKAKHSLCMKKNADLTPRLEILGGALFSHYETEYAKLEGREETILTGINEKAQDKKEKQEILAETENTLNKKREEFGRLSGEIGIFSKREDEFNKSYKMNLTRNVLGRYEDGLLEIMQSEVEREISSREKEQTLAAADRDREERQRKKLFSDKEDAVVLHARLSVELKEAERELESLESEKEVRLGVLKLLQLEPDRLFDIMAVLKALDARLNQLDIVINEGNEKLNVLQKEIKALTDGEIMELPTEMQDGFKKLGLDMVFGLKWLQRNGYSKKKNAKLVKENPFLPYALILTGNELKRLKEQNEIFTSVPVPIVLRDTLEAGIVNVTDKVVELDGISFYLNFNEAFLDEELLARMVEKKREEADRIKSRIETRKEEHREYSAKHSIVENQRLSREKYDGAKDLIQKLSTDKQEVSDRLKEITEGMEENERQITGLTERLKETEKEADALRHKKDGIKRFCGEYEEYLHSLDKKEKVSGQISELEDIKRITKEVIERISLEEAELARRLSDTKREKADTETSLSTYASYKGKQADDSLKKLSIAEIGAEFRSIKDKYSGELSELEEDMKRLDLMIQAAGKDLDRLKNKYRLSQEDLQNEIYDELLEDELAVKEREQQGIIKKKREELSAIDVIIAQTVQRRKDLFESMKRDTGYDKCLPEEDIARSDFGARKNKLLDQIKGLKGERNEQKIRHERYQSLLDSLSEYDAVKVVAPVEWEDDLSMLSIESLRGIQADLKRGYNSAGARIQSSRNALSDRLNEILNISELADSYYRKPVEAMIRLLDSPDDVLSQIDITIRSYDTLMEKIAVDISLVESERDELTDELLSYIGNVNEGLSKIDSNSTILIREQRVKMLQITVPDWQDNRETYSLKLKDYFEGLTKAVIAILNKNENPEDYIGLKVNVKNLYDVIIGIGGISIQIYKVEKQRTYPITWSDAARNSGGEGFLSAFIILSSLLYYIRRDENDVFAQKNEGKVLLMDNPFAQTNAEHLLKPLMDMARKNNTQLICLTGLGGDSIYGRFDNIYVLNLVSAKLGAGLQYLRTEHTKGTEPESMEVSQVEVYDQITLF